MVKEYLSILRCPLCRGDLVQQDAGLMCAHDEVVFPIRDGMPIMLIEQAVKLTESHDAQ